jgi:hypothetical protein
VKAAGCVGKDVVSGSEDARTGQGLRDASHGPSIDYPPVSRTGRGSSQHRPVTITLT